MQEMNSERHAVQPEHVMDNSKSLHDELLHYLRAYLVGDMLQEGDRIPERELCERLGVSRTPLREALKVLASDGLVELLPNRGARVRQITPEELCEVFEVLQGFEMLAGQLSCERITDGEIAEIEKLHYRMYSAYMRRDLPDYFECNQAIHAAILASTRNTTLIEAHSRFATRVERARYHANRTKRRDRWSEAMREHEQILEALQKRDKENLPILLGQHLGNKCKAILDELVEGTEARSTR